MVEGLAHTMPLTQACAALGLARASIYRALRPPRPFVGPRQVYRPECALSQPERDQVRSVLNSPEYMDLAPRAVFARLLDTGEYLCSWRTMYRLLAEYGEVAERRAVRPPRAYVRPELVATRPNQVWSWDITKLKGAAKGQFFYLYVILDIYSRCVVGWLVAEREGEDLARQLVAETAAKHGIEPDSLTLHADRGSPMIAGKMKDLLESLGITKSHSRPRVSNDNPFSEAQFKTLKYRPAYPGRFGELDQAADWARRTITWYNDEHYHSGVALLTPATVHAGQAATVLAERQRVLDLAFAAHPKRFPRGRPSAGRLPEKVWINEPALQVAKAEPGIPVPEAPLPVSEPSAQPGSRAGTAPSRVRRQRTLDVGEHSATSTTAPIQELASAQ
jgi:putative transposase